MGEENSEKKSSNSSSGGGRKGSSSSSSSPINGFSPASSTRVFWQSRKRRASSLSANKPSDVPMLELDTPPRQEPVAEEEEEKMDDDTTPPAAVLSERRKALFEPLDPIDNLPRKRPSNESLLPPPDFDTTSYPKGWVIGKKRKLVNVDVVESMRRIAIQEMNRKDREIDGLNEQLDEDSRVLEHLQVQLLEEKRKRGDVERENNMLQDQINMLMNMLQESEGTGEGEEGTDELQ